jgi:hypothetical protein
VARLEELGPRRNDQEQRPPSVTNDSFEKVEQLLLGPVDVLDEDDRRALTDDLLEELDPRVLKAIACGQGVKPVRNVEPKRQA